ncbi:MAG: iron-sulfur cluster assembly accessory protein [Bacteroidota bacterium]|nr:iron-sulfur cluster assembly accessory protein [Bacteroidota bacterium]
MSDITISDSAYNRICEIKASDHDKRKNLLQISIISGGCSGLSYDLKLVNRQNLTIKESDHLFEFPDFNIFIDMRSYLMLAGTELDFSDGLEGKGFHFHNPNARRTCSCGDSFSL